MSTSAVSAGKASFMKLRYVDGQLFLTYHHGQTCHNGLRRSTIIVFYCNESAGLGSPIFNQERHCNYFFDWPTNLVCPRARKTGKICVYFMLEVFTNGCEILLTGIKQTNMCRTCVYDKVLKQIDFLIKCPLYDIWPGSIYATAECPSN